MQVKKKKLFITLTLVVVCLALLISASFAWLSLSRTPEVTGIETNVGANGSLEIALLTGHTYMYPDEIRTAIGSSMEKADATVSNLTWGNVIDLSDESYGLGQISLLPARLDVTALGDRNSVHNNLLMIPNYSEDGRFSGFNNGMVSGAYLENGFYYDPEQAQHGVRGIGTIYNVSAQQVALTEAKTSVVSFHSAASNAMQSVWRANGAGLFDIFYRLYAQDAQSFTAEDVALLRDTATRMLGVLDYVDSALRQSVIGYAASVMSNESEFKTLRNTVGNSAISLSMLMQNVPVSIPNSFRSSITRLDQDKAAVRAAISYCDSLDGMNPNNVDITRILVDCGLMNPSLVYFGEVELSEMDGTLESDNKLKLFAGRDGNGVMDGIAGYIGSYSVFFTYKEGVSVEVAGEMLTGKAALTLMSEQLNSLTAAGSVTSGQVILSDMYGYAIDMAFRCNTTSDLLLQTIPSLRVDENTQFLQEQGGGSYMRFQTEYLKLEQMLPLMDAIRIGFLNNQNDLVAIAKLNTSNYEETEEGVAAPLYLYNFTVAADGSISMGERLKDDAAITELPDSEPVVMTVVVWLDGDHVENSYVAINAQSMTGVLNLQFASSAELDPAYKDDPDATKPEGTQPTAPTEPDATEPTEPEAHDEYYLGMEDGQLSFYTMNENGSRDYVLNYNGTVDEENHTIVVESVVEYPEQGIWIPALASYNGVQYAVSIDPSAPFADLKADAVHISFVPIGNSKVGITDPVLSDLFDARFDANGELRSIYRSLGLSGLDTSTATDMSYLFESCTNLVTLDITAIDTKNVHDMSCMFAGCQKLIKLDVRNFDTRNVSDMDGMFYRCLGLKNLDVSSFVTTNVANMGNMFGSCISITELDLSTFNTSNVVDMAGMFSQCSNLSELDISSFNTEKVKYMDSMFYRCSSLAELDVSHFDTANVTDMSYMFYYCCDLTELDVSNFDTARVTDMSSMFSYCKLITELDVSHFDTTRVTNMASMFSSCDELRTLDTSNFNTSSVTDMSGMFAFCSHLKTIDVSGFDTTNVTTMRSMFHACHWVQALAVGGFSTANVTDMSYMFYFCDALTELDLSNFDTAKVTNMSVMFQDCSGLTELDLSNFDTANVTNMAAMFQECSGLTELDVSNFDTAKVTDMAYMFYWCSSLTELDLSNFNTANVTDMSDMFSWCSSLTELDLSNFDTANVTDMSWMFNRCSSLRVLDLSGWDMSKADTTGMFEDCPAEVIYS